jgi:spore coat protein U-like protein
MKGILLALFLVLTQQTVLAQTCKITNISHFNFGNYDVANPIPADSVGSITIACEKNTKVTIQLDRGLYGTFMKRAMKHAHFPDLLYYNIFVDPGRTIIWGDGSGGTESVNVNVKAKNPITINIYGRIFPLQNVSVGPYSDTIIVIILP